MKGSEDGLRRGMASYKSYSFQTFFDTIEATYPDMNIIASSIRLSPVPEGAWLSSLVYARPDEFIKSFGFFDGMDRSNPKMVTEHAYTQDSRPQGGGVDYAAQKTRLLTVIGAAHGPL